MVQDLSDEERETFGKKEPEIVFLREIENKQADDTRFIVIDDLDAGFSVVDKSNRFKIQPITRVARSFIGVSDRDMIRGLPAFQFEDVAVPEDTWERKAEPTAYGKYWKTFAVNQKRRWRNLCQICYRIARAGTLASGVLFTRTDFSLCGTIRKGFYSKV